MDRVFIHCNFVNFFHARPSPPPNRFEEKSLPSFRVLVIVPVVCSVFSRVTTKYKTHSQHLSPCSGVVVPSQQPCTVALQSPPPSAYFDVLSLGGGTKGASEHTGEYGVSCSLGAFDLRVPTGPVSPMADFTHFTPTPSQGRSGASSAARVNGTRPLSKFLCMCSALLNSCCIL